jgi:hypothetical protein
VGINTAISVTFSEAMNTSTVTTTTFTVTAGSTVVPGSVGYSGATATFTPTGNLAYSTPYTATVTTGAQDLAGNALASNHVWNFTTGTAPDTAPPTVSSTNPANGATGVGINTAISVTFSEAMNASTVTTTTFTVTAGSTVVPGSVGYSGTTATFTPTGNLAYSTPYTATVTTGAQDLAGNALASNHVWNFTTGTAPDTSAPISTSLWDNLVTTGAVCFGKVNPNGLPSTAWFEWGTDPVLSSFNTSASQPIGSGTTNEYMNEALTGLAPGTTYHWRVVGKNSKGTSRGAIMSFIAETGPWGFFDDFSTDTTGGYSVFTSLGTESFAYDSTGKKAHVTTGNGGNLVFSHSFPYGNTGSFSLDFHPTSEYGSGGSMKVRLMDTPNTYYELSTADERIIKYRAGAEVDNVPFPHSYSQGGNYTIKITFGPMVTTVEAFGGRASMTLNQAANPVNYFEIWSTQQDAYYDNIKEALPP